MVYALILFSYMDEQLYPNHILQSKFAPVICYTTVFCFEFQFLIDGCISGHFAISISILIEYKYHISLIKNLL